MNCRWMIPWQVGCVVPVLQSNLWIEFQSTDLDLAQSQVVGFEDNMLKYVVVSQIWGKREEYYSLIEFPSIWLTYPEYNGGMRSYCMLKSAHWCIMAHQLCLQTERKLGMHSGMGMSYPLDTQFSPVLMQPVLIRDLLTPDSPGPWLQRPHWYACCQTRKARPPRLQMLVPPWWHQGHQNPKFEMYTTNVDDDDDDNDPLILFWWWWWWW